MEQISKITLGMPVFNDIDFIEESLISILNQTYKDFVLIISDDGSTDGSNIICEKYAAIDYRIKYIRQAKNLGISKNMEFLLSQAKTPYFMWAADDDLWADTFIEKLIGLLEQNQSTASAFCTFATINEKGDLINSQINYNYQNCDRLQRLKNYIKTPNDTFGYGIFRTEKIKKVKFPLWFWPNHKCAYNNIYPTLCYYLAQGDYIQYTGEPLFFNRIKSNEKVNHKLPYRRDGIRETLAYIARKMNLINFSFSNIRKAGGLCLALKLYPLLFIKWFILPSYFKSKHCLKAKIMPHKIPWYNINS